MGERCKEPFKAVAEQQSSKAAAAAAVGGISVKLSILINVKITGGLVDAGVAFRRCVCTSKGSGEARLGSGNVAPAAQLHRLTLEPEAVFDDCCQKTPAYLINA